MNSNRYPQGSNGSAQALMEAEFGAALRESLGDAAYHGLFSARALTESQLNAFYLFQQLITEHQFIKVYTIV